MQTSVAIGFLLGIMSTVAQQLIVVPGPSQKETRAQEPEQLGASRAIAWKVPSLPLSFRNGQTPAAIQEFIFDSLVNAFSYYSWQQQPVWWDPTSDVLVTVKRGGVGAAAQGDGNRLYYRYSTNRGQSWSEPIRLFDGNAPTNQLPRYPSGYLVNPNNTVTSPQDLILVFASPVTDGTAWRGFRDGFTYLGSNDVQSWFNDGVDVTIQGRQYRYTWGTDSRITATRAGDVALTLSALVAPDGVPTAEQNYVGLRLQDFAAPAFGFVPEEWRSTLFGDPGQPGYRANVPIGIARDDVGNLVYAVFGRFVDADDPGLPTVGFFLSTDGGESWRGPTFLQPSAIREYAFQQGAMPDSVVVPFGLQTGQGGAIAIPKAFAAYGNGKVSIAFQIFEFDGSKPLEERAAQMVEATYDNGNWTLRKIADRSWLSLALIADPNSPASTQVGNELQLSRTADGTKLLAKWIEGTVYVAQVDIDGDGAAPDTFLTTDVYISTRQLPNGQWSDPVNITQTPIWDKLAWIPPIVPNDLRQVPLLMVKTAIDTFVYPTLLERLVNSQQQLLEKQYVTIATFSGVVSVQEPSATIHRQLQVRVSPHPVGRELRLFVSDAPGGHASVELYAASGERLWTRELVLAPGSQMVILPVSEVAAGTYVLRVRNGSAVAIQPVVVLP